MGPKDDGWSKQTAHTVCLQFPYRHWPKGTKKTLRPPKKFWVARHHPHNLCIDVAFRFLRSLFRFARQMSKQRAFHAKICGKWGGSSNAPLLARVIPVKRDRTDERDGSIARAIVQKRIPFQLQQRPSKEDQSNNQHKKSLPTSRHGTSMVKRR